MKPNASRKYNQEQCKYIYMPQQIDAWSTLIFMTSTGMAEELQKLYYRLNFNMLIKSAQYIERSVKNNIAKQKQVMLKS